jgi:sulfite exporter TauE/SafE/copper chaperone CopZ
MKTKIKVKGMHCTSCEKIIQGRLADMEGISSCKADYAKQEVSVNYDENKVSENKIKSAIEKEGYSCCADQETKGSRAKPIILTLALLVILFGGYQVVQSLPIFALPQLGPGTSLVLLFAAGLLTGFHCIGMCGGFMMSYTTKSAMTGNSSLKMHTQYGLGKLASYTTIGALFGLAGSIIVFTPMLRGIAGVLAGLFLVVFGLNMLNVFPALRRIRIPMPAAVSRFSAKHNVSGNPLTVGLLNGLMIACGPLQAIYIYATGTGSMIEGASALFAFGLGTLPVMFGFGAFASHVSKSMTQNILKFSGVIVLVLGVIMLNRGLALTGTGLDANSLLASVSAVPVSGNMIANGTQGAYQEIHMDVLSSGWSPDKFVLKKGVPVKWIINGKELTSCNNAIEVPKLGLSFKIKPGLQTIEFTPTEDGVISWSCWMGMIPGTFVVKSDVNLNNTAEVQGILNSTQTPKSSGSCGCGMKKV